MLKHHVAGPKPNHNMAKSADATIKVADHRILLKEQKAAKAMNSIPTKVQSCLAPLYDMVCSHAADKIAANWEHQLKLAEF